MSKSESHKRAQKKAAGKGGKTEVKLKGNQFLDALTKNRKRATEVERSDHLSNLKAAAKRLKKSGAGQKVLQVPQKNMDKAVEALKKERVVGTVKNMGGTKKSMSQRRKLKNNSLRLLLRFHNH